MTTTHKDGCSCGSPDCDSFAREHAYDFGESFDINSQLSVTVQDGIYTLHSHSDVVAFDTIDELIESLPDDLREPARTHYEEWNKTDGFAVGDLAYLATGERGDRQVDCRTPYRKTEAEAIKDCKTWLDSLSEREQRNAAAWVRAFSVESVNECGEIDAARTTDVKCWESE